MTTQLEKIFKERGFVETIKSIEERRGLPFDRKLQLSYLEAIVRGMLQIHQLDEAARSQKSQPWSGLLQKRVGQLTASAPWRRKSSPTSKVRYSPSPVSSSALLHG